MTARVIPELVVLAAAPAESVPMPAARRYPGVAECTNGSAVGAPCPRTTADTTSRTEATGRGFGEKKLRRMSSSPRLFPDAEIVAALRRQSSWAHFKLLVPLKDGLRRDFYAEMCRVEGWSTRTLEQSASRPNCLRSASSCAAGKKRETVEYLDLGTRGIDVAEYLTELPPREVLEERLHRAIEAARNRLALGPEGATKLDIVPLVSTTRSVGGRAAKSEHF